MPPKTDPMTLWLKQTKQRATPSRSGTRTGFDMRSFDRDVGWLDHFQTASGARSLSEMSPRSSGVDSAWKYGLIRLAMDDTGGV